MTNHRHLTLLTALLLAPLAAFRAAPKPALIAHWSFAEGSGEVLHDKSGNQHDGAIHGASWVRVGDGFGLHFGANKSFVDFGDVAALKRSGDFTFSAWVKPMAEMFPDKNTNWHLFTWEEYRLSGFNCRLDGRSGRTYARSSPGAEGSPATAGLLEVGAAWEDGKYHRAVHPEVKPDALPVCEVNFDNCTSASPSRPSFISGNSNLAATLRHVTGSGRLVSLARSLHPIQVDLTLDHCRCEPDDRPANVPDVSLGGKVTGRVVVRANTEGRPLRLAVPESVHVIREQSRPAQGAPR